MRVKSIAGAAAVLAGSVPGAAFAASLAIATTDLNIRSGPGPQFPIVGALRANDQATIEGCIRDSRWCRVASRGMSGWAYTEYMQAAGDTAPLGTSVTTTRRTVEPGRTTVTTTTTERSVNAFGAPTVVYDAPATVGVAPEISDTVVTTGPAVVRAEPPLRPPGFIPPPEVRTYVASHPLEPIDIDEDVVVGAGLPASVELQPVPNFEYDYAYVNERPVLVEPRSRRIVYVYR
jgi:uncharacterized protein YraI